MTHFVGVPANYQLMQALPAFRHARLRDFCDGVGGAPVPAPLVASWAGRGVTPGYWRQPQATAEAVRDGWLHTGDIAVAGRDGRIRIVDRTKDMYISGGENVYPAEVEEALYHHPAIAEVAVVGVADQRWGETGAAWVVLAAGTDVTPDGLRAWARTQIAAFKVPREFHLVGELPRNATGKVLKAELRRRAVSADGGETERP